ncbi:MAG TPA: hypothetical protein VJM34_00525 [Novosphingobium sp.]|nr:hypothetical protein [Novosphingobium sp.]
MAQKAVSMRLIISAASLCMALTSCATSKNAISYSCGKDGSAHWKQRSAPFNADELSAIAKANPVWAGHGNIRDRWFGSGERVMLCRSDTLRGKPGSSEWWIFDNRTTPATLEKSDGVLIVS